MFDYANISSNATKLTEKSVCFTSKTHTHMHIQNGKMYKVVFHFFSSFESTSRSPFIFLSLLFF